MEKPGHAADSGADDQRWEKVKDVLEMRKSLEGEG